MYSPKIKEDLVRVLYQLKIRLDVPMTALVDDLLRPEVEEMSKIFLQEETNNEYRVNRERV